VVVIPAHNEQKFLAPTVTSINTELNAMSDNYLLVIAEDGSTDNTVTIAKKLEEELPHVVCIHHREKLGRGLAVERIWANIEAKVYAFLDCDMATDLSYFREMLVSIGRDADTTTGSRYLPESVTLRPTLRRAVSRSYNQLIRLLFNTNCSDHQCGFKAASREAVRAITSRTICAGWEWDTEFIVMSKKLGFSLKEIPVYWVERRGKRTPIRRLFKDIIEHGFWTFKLLQSRSIPLDKKKLWCLEESDIALIQLKSSSPIAPTVYVQTPVEETIQVR
jgi:glycosyltransferase involved in cell wall biosynthesis